MSSVGMNGGQLAARMLAEAGVKVVFGLHGGHLDSFLTACVEEGIKLVDCRHEAAAVNAADGYARTTNGLGVAVVTSGPGLTNGLAGITNAAADNVPVLVITSSSPIREVEMLELQGSLDLIAMLTPVCRWARKVLAPERVPDIVGMAIRRALSERGPTVVDIPIDVAFTPVPPQRVPHYGSPIVESTTVAAKADVAKAMQLLAQAERPVIIAGERGLNEDFRESLLHFAEHSGIPVFTSGLAPFGLPGDHPQNGGNLSFMPLIGEAPDLVVLAGTRQGMFIGGRGGTLIPDTAKIIQIDLDASEIGRLYPVDVGLVGSISHALDTLAIEKSQRARNEAWCAKAITVRNIGLHMFRDASLEADGIHPFRIARDIVEQLPEETILVLDGGESAAWVSWALAETRVDSVLNLGYQGHLGVGQGYAIGAQLAHPDKRVVQLAGDGAIAFHIQEWDTMVRHNLPIVTVIFNNACWGMSIHGQEAVYGKGKDVISKLAPTTYERVGEGFGTYGEYVDTVEEIGPAVQRALATNKPAVINVRTSAEIVHPITTSLLGDVNAKDEIVVPYYQNLPK